MIKILPALTLALLFIAQITMADEKDFCDADRFGYSQKVDAAYDQFSQALCFPSRWFDRFFATTESDEWEQAGTTLRVVQEQTIRDDHHYPNSMRVQTHIRLPNLERRFSLLFANDDDVEDEHYGLQEDRRKRTDSAPEGFRAAARWAVRTSKRINLDLDVGLRSELHAYSQLRYRWKKKVSDRDMLRFTQKITFLDPVGFSTHTLNEFSRVMTPQSLMQFSAGFYRSELTEKEKIGWTVTPGMSYHYRLNSSTAIQTSAVGRFYTQPHWQAQLYRMSTLYRQNIFRPWFYYEIEPFWEWPIEYDFKTVTGISFRIEALFGYVR